MSVSTSKVLRLPFADGVLFGRYQLLAKLGQGGMADVYLAVARGPEGFNKLIVIKRLKDNVAEDQDAHVMFLDEARLAARLNHANVVQTYEFGTIDGHYYLTMEYLEGQPLNRVMNRAVKRDGENTLPLAFSLRVIADALQGLHYAHELADYDGRPLNIVHRDVSPHNVFVTYDGQVKLVDFGIAKAAVRSAETGTGIVKGKISYMAPEQALSHPIDRRADIFSIGVILWELITGQRFWAHLTEVQILQKMAFGEPPRLRDHKADAPEELERICDRAVALAPGSRYGTAAEFRRDLESVIASYSLSTSEMGVYVSELFADRRAELKAVIGEQMRGALSNARSIPVLDVQPASESRRSSVHDDTPNKSLEATPSAATHSSQIKVPMRRSRTPIVLGVSAIAAAAGILVMALKADPVRSDKETASATAQASSPASSTAAQATVVEVRLQATPGEATIFIDDVAAAANPFAAKFPNDGTAHRIRVEAAGYKSYARMVVFDKSPSQLDIALDRDLGAQAASSSAPSAPGKPGGAGRRPGSGSGAKVDATDPWKK